MILAWLSSSVYNRIVLVEQWLKPNAAVKSKAAAKYRVFSPEKEAIFVPVLMYILRATNKAHAAHAKSMRVEGFLADSSARGWRAKIIIGAKIITSPLFTFTTASMGVVITRSRL